MVHTAEEGRPDQETCDRTRENGTEVERRADEVVDAVAEPERHGRKRIHTDKPCRKTAEAACRNVCRRPGNAPSEAEDRNVVGHDACQNTACKAADEAAAAGHQTGDDTGHDTDLVKPRNLLCRDGGNDDRNGADQRVEYGGQPGQGGDLTECKDDRHGDEAGERRHHDAAEVDTLPHVAVLLAARALADDGHVLDLPFLCQCGNERHRAGTVGRAGRARGGNDVAPHLLGDAHRGAARADAGELLGRSRRQRRFVDAVRIAAHHDDTVDAALLDQRGQRRIGCSRIRIDLAELLFLTAGDAVARQRPETGRRIH